MISQFPFAIPTALTRIRTSSTTDGRALDFSDRENIGCEAETGLNDGSHTTTSTVSCPNTVTESSTGPDS